MRNLSVGLYRPPYYLKHTPVLSATTRERDIIIHHWSYTIGESSNPSCVSVGTHISITAGRNFLILGMIMGYDVGMMPVILFNTVSHPRPTDKNVCF